MYMSHRESSSSHYESYKPGFYQGEGQIFLVTILPLAQSRSSKINNIAAADRASGLQFPQAMRRSGYLGVGPDVFGFLPGYGSEEGYRDGGGFFIVDLILEVFITSKSGGIGIGFAV